MPRPKVFTVGLSAADREFLVKLTTSGTHPARMIMRARVLLELDENAGPVADRAVIADRVGPRRTPCGRSRSGSRDRRRRAGHDRAQTAADAAGGADRDRRGRGPVDRAGLLDPAPGFRPLVAATAGETRRPGRGSARSGPLHHRPGVKKRHCVLI